MTDFDAEKMTRLEMAAAIKKATTPEKKKKFEFAKESDLCAAFISLLPKEWQAYPETAGFDILLVRKEDGFQIGVEAKLKLNAKVICQVAERTGKWYVTSPGPDCRAVLVPYDASGDLAGVCGLLGLTVIWQHHPDDNFQFKYNKFCPSLPRTDERWENDHWHEFSPSERHAVPDYVPDVGAGHSAPVMLTHWKIAAIKIAVTIEKRGYVTRDDFKHHDISMSRWTQGVWLVKSAAGGWVRGCNLPDFKAQHPVNYVEIEKDYDVWKMKEKAAVQPALI